MATFIHPTAIVQEGAFLDEDVSVGPYCIVGPLVRIGKGTRLHGNVVLEGRTEIGRSCQLYPFSYLGQPPQDLKYRDEDTAVTVGDRTIIREYVTVHRASVGGDGVTRVGDDTFLMAYVHVAHDCRVGGNVVMASYAGLSGHVLVEDNVIIGGHTGIHQFVRIGEYAMVGGVSGVRQDVPPYMIASGVEARLYGLNVVGLKRKGFSAEAIGELKRAYSVLFQQNLSMDAALEKVTKELPPNRHILHLVEFIQAKKRGICR
ncbi:MAG: acyl-ACP--UDP-N-acetylglucosamine O-acyltransferase [Nitrospirota bacterium]|jgi:UDP-N-acetylglucosamine acyltransferase